MIRKSKKYWIAIFVFSLVAILSFSGFIKVEEKLEKVPIEVEKVPLEEITETPISPQIKAGMLLHDETWSGEILVADTCGSAG